MVIKFNPARAAPVMMLGRKPEASDEFAHPLEHPEPPLPAVDGLFRQVTDMTFDPQGNIYVSDGYINSRVAKFDKDGNWLMQWGDRGQYMGTTEPPTGRMFQPHTIASDAQGNIYVGDRANSRIQVFNGTGQFQRVIKIDVTAPAGMKPVIGNVPNPNAVNKSSVARLRPGRFASRPDRTRCSTAPIRIPGRIYKLTLDGRLLGQIGEFGRAPGKFAWIHGIACPSENNLLVAELLSWRVSKLTLRPTAQQRADSK